MQRILFFTLWLSILSWLSACTEDTIAPITLGTLEGIVTADDLPLPNVNITTQPATNQLLTDSAGRFSIAGIPADTYTITVRGEGIRTTSLTALVTSDSATEVTIRAELTELENRAPNTPVLVSPQNEASDLSRTLTLTWQGADPDEDSLHYEVRLFTSQSNLRQSVVAQNLADTALVVRDLQFATTYFWQVIATDPNGLSSQSEVGSFTIQPIPNLRIAWVSNTSGNAEIYASDGSDTTIVQVTNQPARDVQPQLHPRLSQVAFASNVQGETQLFMTPLIDGTPTQVTQVPLAGFHNIGTGYTWSPDGGQLAYAHYHELYRINANGSGLTVVTQAPVNRHFREMDWTAVGNQFVLQTIGTRIYDAEIYLYSPAEDSMRLLVANHPGQLHGPSFSVDGQEVLFTYDASEFQSLEGRQLDSRIYRVPTTASPDSIEWMDVSVNKPAGTNDLRPRYSPDGAKIIFENAPNDDPRAASVWVMDLNGDNRQLLYQHAQMPDWR
ncbi:carboxypeptidase regulatory-like domain-containing protein [Tunicatimonas pelagia]|uniref:carboxypeptidase regulatory-like domain-containing protein n=1 Tax=Tunicatimonas pelagia TaxID=931531 RepID=UPI002665A665|nr:carboxypeptidase regulatory-like domain-containing protein [Tunicatimonas pelagia]WKN43195.1 carboxypeptidase regulatory-like domain-containing protein [Tunicatimonas pelagia]